METEKIIEKLIDIIEEHIDDHGEKPLTNVDLQKILKKLIAPHYLEGIF
jgi:hypothetical protein